jgi:hypothetical protein
MAGQTPIDGSRNPQNGLRHLTATITYGGGAPLGFVVSKRVPELAAEEILPALRTLPVARKQDGRRFKGTLSLRDWIELAGTVKEAVKKPIATWRDPLRVPDFAIRSILDGPGASTTHALTPICSTQLFSFVAGQKTSAGELLRMGIANFGGWPVTSGSLWFQMVDIE